MPENKPTVSELLMPTATYSVSPSDHQNMLVPVLDAKGREVTDWYKTLRGNWLMDRYVKMRIDPHKAIGLDRRG